jgi:uncharacterized damage-inducible protein DinB
MRKEQLERMYTYFKMVLGMTRRLVDEFPADKMDFRPTPETRTVAEIVSHNYTFLADAATMAQTGKFVEPKEPALTTKDQALRFMDAQVEKLYATFAGLTEAQLETMVDAYGDRFPAWQFLAFAYDEHWHHRGQLTVYLRMCGVKPLMIYDYGVLQAQS